MLEEYRDFHPKNYFLGRFQKIVMKYGTYITPEQVQCGNSDWSGGQKLD